METQWNTVFEYVYSDSVPNSKDKLFLGTRASPRVCIICNRDENTTTFIKDAHVIPAGFGNRTLFILNECDKCNESAGRELENDLASFLTLARAFARNRTRKGSFKYKKGSRSSFIESGSGSNIVSVVLVDGENDIKVTRTAKNTFKVEIEKPPYRPMNVSKALARMAVRALPFVGDKYLQRTRLWVEGAIRISTLSLTHIFVPGAGLAETRLKIGKSKDPAHPHLLITFWFSTVILVVQIPEEGCDLRDGVPLPPFTAILPGAVVTQFETIDGDEKRGEREFMTFNHANCRMLTAEEIKTATASSKFVKN